MDASLGPRAPARERVAEDAAFEFSHPRYLAAALAGRAYRPCGAWAPLPRPAPAVRPGAFAPGSVATAVIGDDDSVSARVHTVSPGEHLDVADSGWPLRVETTELLGAERLVYGRLGDEQVIVRHEEGPIAPPKPDSTIHVRPREDRVHWFDAGTGKRIAS